MKRFLLLLAVCGVAWSQPQAGTVFQRVFTAQTALGRSAPVRNIGQLGHSLLVQWSNRGALVCAVGAVSPVNLGMEASFDAATWFRIGPLIPWVGALNGQDVITVDGVYPYVAANLRAIDANCQVDAWYAGSAFSTANNVTSAIGLEKTYQASVAVVGPTVIAPVLVGAEIVSVYEVTVWNPAPNLPNTITFGSTTGGVCTARFPITTLCTNCGFVFPYTGKVHFTGFEHVGANGGDLCLLLGNATPVDVFVRYRYE